jgi:nucleotide-binding universal stress UspA family protein
MDTTKILLAVDGSPCTEAAVQMLIARIRPEQAEVRVRHAIEWLKTMPQSLRFGVGPHAARDGSPRDATHAIPR